MLDKVAGFRGTKYVGVAELAAAAAALLAESGPLQERGTVSALPDERTVRYYLAEGLVTPAGERRGTASLFGYLQLLQILVVKHLQARHLPIRQIRELVAGRRERELEELLGGGGEAKNAALSYLETLIAAPPPPPRPPAAPETQGPLARELMSMRQEPAYRYSAPAGTWDRLEIEPGLELHIHSSYVPPAETKGLRRLAQLLINALEAYSRPPGGGK